MSGAADPVATAAQVEAFTRDVLGCSCPAEVFRRVQVEDGVAAAGHRLRRRITVGDRLLIYLVDAPEVDGGPDAMATLCRAGAAERDRRGLNRFRLVVAGKGTNGAVTAPELPDDRCHLHHVTAAEAAWAGA